MGEVTVFRIVKDGDFGGLMDIPLTRNSGFTESPGKRIHEASATGHVGVVPSDIWGWFPAESAKLVGVAFSSNNPASKAMVIDGNSRVRMQINLTTYYQYVLLHPGDRLAVATREAPNSRVELTIAVNELSEREHVSWALAHPATDNHVRLKIVRTTGFQLNLGSPPWFPTFVWDEPSSTLVANETQTTAPIPLSTLSPWVGLYGAYVSVRFSGITGTASAQIVEFETRRGWDLDGAGIPEGKWSRVGYLAHNDLLAFSASMLPAGSKCVVDIELTRVEAPVENRLMRRYGAPEAPGDNL